jgi:hypothetical protein
LAVFLFALLLAAPAQAVVFTVDSTTDTVVGVPGDRLCADASGYVYVTDWLRSVVLVFDASLNFQNEFGYRGCQPSSLIVPDDVATDRSGNVYVARAANHGVSVFSVVRKPRVHKTSVRERRRVRAKSVPVRDRNVLSSRRSKQETRPGEDGDLTSTAAEKSDRILEEVLP